MSYRPEDRLTREQLERIKWNLGHGSEVDALFAHIEAIEEAAIEDHDYLGAENARLREAIRTVVMRLPILPLSPHETTAERELRQARERLQTALDGEA